MKTLAIEPLTKDAFAPFGDVIELEGAKQIPITLGTTIRYHDLAKVDVTDAGGRTPLAGSVPASPSASAKACNPRTATTARPAELAASGA